MAVEWLVEMRSIDFGGKIWHVNLMATYKHDADGTRYICRVLSPYGKTITVLGDTREEAEHDLLGKMERVRYAVEDWKP